MTQTTTLVLGEELDRLDQEVENLASALGEVEDDTASGRMLRREATSADTQGQAVANLAATYGMDADVVIQPMTAGNFARVEDRLSAMQSHSSQPGGLPGSSRNVYAAVGLVEAPFFDPDDVGDDEDALNAKLRAVTGQEPGVAKWLESRIDGLSSNDEGNWRPLRERLADSSTD